MTQNRLTRRKKGVEKYAYVQDYLPIKNLRSGILETTDGRYIKLLEVE